MARYYFGLSQVQALLDGALFTFSNVKLSDPVKYLTTLALIKARSERAVLARHSLSSANYNGAAEYMAS